MADGMKMIVKRAGGREKGVSRLFVAAGSLLLAVSGLAAELVDPTLPPASIAAPESVKSELNQSPGLKSIIIGKNRRAAIIDGQTVELGGKLGEARLVEVNEGSIVLRTMQGRQELKLFADVEMLQKNVVVDTPAIKVRSGKHKPLPSGEKQ